MGESPAQFCLIIQHCLRRQASKYLGCSKSLISPDGSRSTFSNASVNLFYLENQRPNGLEENCVWCSYPCQSRQVSCGGCSACQSTSICLWWKTQMVAVLQNNETGHNSKGKDILKIMPFFIATEDLVNLHSLMRKKMSTNDLASVILLVGICWNQIIGDLWKNANCCRIKQGVVFLM